MLLSEIIFQLVLQLNWKNILLLNAYEEESICLLRLLNNIGRPVSTMSYIEMRTYPWPERISTEPPMNGYLMMLQNQTHLIDILQFLQQKYMMAPNCPWIIGVAGPFRATDFSPYFDEGSQVVFINRNYSKNNELYLEKNSYDLRQEISLWTLRSLGNGSVRFVEVNFLNLSRADQIFDAPFRNFRSRVLRISSLGSPPIHIRPKEQHQRWGGYIFRIINTLADFFNFTYTVKEAEDRFYGMEQEDGSWTGMIGELIRKRVHIGCGDLSFSLDRYSVIDLTKPVFPETVTFIYSAPDFYSRTWILFQGIDPKVWIGMMSATIAAFVVYFLGLSFHQMWHHHAKDPAVVCIESADESISSLYRALLGKGVLCAPSFTSCRIVLGVWFVGSLILNVHYGGSLTSKLSLHQSPKPADSLKELLKRHPNARLALRNNSQIHQFFKKSGYWQQVFLKNMEKYVIPGKLHIEDTMIRVHNISDNKAPYVWIAERSMLVKMMQVYTDDSVVCDLYVAKESIIRSDWSIALQRNSPFTKQFDEMITRMARMGLLERWRREFWESATGSCHPTDGLNQSAETPISIDDTIAIFIVLATGWIVGIVILIGERLCYFSCSISLPI